MATLGSASKGGGGGRSQAEQDHDGEMQRLGVGRFKPEDVTAKSRVKTVVRSLRRLLAKLPEDAAIRGEKQQELDAWVVRLEELIEDSKAKHVTAKYSKHRFFERKKAERKIAQTRASLAKLQEPGVDGSQNQMSAQERELRQQLKEAEADLDYIVNFPVGLKYVALYVGEGPEVQERRDAIRTQIGRFREHQDARDRLKQLKSKQPGAAGAGPKKPFQQQQQPRAEGTGAEARAAGQKRKRAELASHGDGDDAKQQDGGEGEEDAGDQEEQERPRKKPSNTNPKQAARMQDWRAKQAALAAQKQAQELQMLGAAGVNQPSSGAHRPGQQQRWQSSTAVAQEEGSGDWNSPANRRERRRLQQQAQERSQFPQADRDGSLADDPFLRFEDDAGAGSGSSRMQDDAGGEDGGGRRKPAQKDTLSLIRQNKNRGAQLQVQRQDRLDRAQEHRQARVQQQQEFGGGSGGGGGRRRGAGDDEAPLEVAIRKPAQQQVEGGAGEAGAEAEDGKKRRRRRRRKAGDDGGDDDGAAGAGGASTQAKPQQQVQKQQQQQVQKPAAVAASKPTPAAARTPQQQQQPAVVKSSPPQQQQQQVAAAEGGEDGQPKKRRRRRTRKAGGAAGGDDGGEGDDE